MRRGGGGAARWCREERCTDSKKCCDLYKFPRDAGDDPVVCGIQPKMGVRSIALRGSLRVLNETTGEGGRPAMRVALRVDPSTTNELFTVETHPGTKSSTTSLVDIGTLSSTWVGAVVVLRFRAGCDGNRPQLVMLHADGAFSLTQTTRHHALEMTVRFPNGNPIPCLPSSIDRLEAHIYPLVADTTPQSAPQPSNVLGQELSTVSDRSVTATNPAGSTLQLPFAEERLGQLRTASASASVVIIPGFGPKVVCNAQGCRIVSGPPFAVANGDPNVPGGKYRGPISCPYTCNV